jgi:8-oxo-dGTP pyrophosphatase MutT (NUDIX family)
MLLSRTRLAAALEQFKELEQGHTHKPQAVVGLLFSEDLAHFLLTRRSDALKSHSGQVALPGGMIDPGESELEALIREFQEELGLSTAPEHWLQPPLKDTRSISDTRVRVYVGQLRGANDQWPLTPQSLEVADWAWCKTEALFESDNWSRIRQVPGTQIPYHGLAWTGWTHLTWGLTAAILLSFVRRFDFDPLK